MKWKKYFPGKKKKSRKCQVFFLKPLTFFKLFFFGKNVNFTQVFPRFFNKKFLISETFLCFLSQFCFIFRVFCFVPGFFCNILVFKSLFKLCLCRFGFLLCWKRSSRGGFCFLPCFGSGLLAARGGGAVAS